MTTIRRLCIGAFAVFTLASGAAFAQGAGRYYPPGTRIDLTQAPYYADKSGANEASGAINQAIKDYAGTGAILYLPHGTYRMTQSLDYAADNNAHYVTLMGDGPGTDPGSATILRVPNNWGYGGMVVETNANTNNAFGVNIWDLTVDTGSGNPNAGGIDFHASNQGSLEDVSVLSEDGQGYQGISLATADNGPLLVKNVTVHGYQFGVDASTSLYSFTLEHIKLSGQTQAGLRDGAAVLAVRDLQSTQTAANVPGVLLADASSHIALIDSQLNGNGGNGITRYGGHYLVRNVGTSGYGDSYGEAVSDPVLTLQSTTSTTLGLPESETPDEWDNNTADWAAVQNSGGGDDTANIQNAMNSGKPVVYFPRFDSQGKPLPRYGLGSGVTIHIPASVKYVLGMGAVINEYGNYGYYAPLFSFEGGSAGGAVYFRDFANITYGGQVKLWQHNTPRNVVLEHCGSLYTPSNGNGGAYNLSYGSGALYIEDVSVGGGWSFPNGQNVWARQFNPEDYQSTGASALADNNGANLWLLGFKTEGAGPWITTEGGGSTEMFGGYDYINTGLSSFPSSIVPYQVTDANVSLDFATSNFTGSDYNNYLEVTRNGNSSYLNASGLYARSTNNPSDASRDVPLFVSDPPVATVYSFGDIGGSGTPVSGAHSGIAFGSGKWSSDAAFAGLGRCGYFTSSTAKSATFTLPSGKFLKSIQVASDLGGTYTISDGKNAARSGSLSRNIPATVKTGWASGGTTITITFSAGWDGAVTAITY